jgi:hypothetical protein
MSRTITPAVVLVAALLALFGVPSVARAEVFATRQASAPLTAADVTPFLGDWALALEGPNGPAAFTLSVKMDKEKPSAELISEAMGTQPITDVAKTDKSLALSYSFTWEGNAVDAVIKLTPAADGKTTAQIDFAGGAYVMTGTATKKDTVK